MHEKKRLVPNSAFFQKYLLLLLHYNVHTPTIYFRDGCNYNFFLKRGWQSEITSSRSSVTNIPAAFSHRTWRVYRQLYFTADQTTSAPAAVPTSTYPR